MGLGDIVVVHAGFLAAFALRFGGAFPAPNFEAYLRAAPGLTALALILFLTNGLYDFRTQSWRTVASGLVVAVTLLPAMGMALSFVARAFALPRTVFFLAWGLQLTFLLGWRNLVWRVALGVRGRDNAVVVGPVAEASEFARRLTAERGAGHKVIGLAATQPGPSLSTGSYPSFGTGSGAPAGTGSGPSAVTGSEASAGTGPGPSDATGVGGLRAVSEVAAAEELAAFPVISLGGLESALREGFPDGSGGVAWPDVLILTPAATLEDKAHVADLASQAGARVLIIPDYRDLLVLDARTAQIDDSLAFEVGPSGLPPHLAWAKRLMDVGFAAIGLVITLPLYPLLALAVRASSPGPVFYSQERVGLGGRPYTIHKFRTMRVDAEAATGPVLATGNDPRVTPVGRFLRRYRLDELPQLFNILVGAMSLVGPRPERPEFVARYERVIPYYRHRHLLKPGLTGLAQLYARYDTPVEEKLRFDLLYAKRYSLVLDFRILFLTARVALKGDEAHWRDANGGGR